MNTPCINKNIRKKFHFEKIIWQSEFKSMKEITEYFPENFIHGVSYFNAFYQRG